MLRITLVIYSLSSGGAERVISAMANYWARQNKLVTLLTFTEESFVPFYELDARVNYQPLNLARKSKNIVSAISANIGRIRKLRAAIINSNPDVVISFLDQTNIQTLLATRGLRFPVIVSERAVTLRSTLSRAWRIMRKWTYFSAEAIVLQTKSSCNHVPSQWKKTTHVIPNPVVNPPTEFEINEQLLPSNSLLAVGRLEPQKGFDLLLKAFAKLPQSTADWTLSILGEGSLRKQLVELRDELGLAEKVFFLGRKPNVYEYFSQADLFVLSSRYEGFPNVLCEAMASGLPVVATDCPCGPSEIITNQVDGILVPTEDVEALSDSLETLMTDFQKCSELRSEAVKVINRFDLSSIMSQWESLIEKVRV